MVLSYHAKAVSYFFINKKLIKLKQHIKKVEFPI